MLNRCPNNETKEKVLEQVWSGKKPFVNHFKVFGSIFHKLVPNASRKKLDDKSEAIILVGYHNIGIYRLFNRITGKLLVCRDIIIYENESWNWASNNINNKPLMN